MAVLELNKISEKLNEFAMLSSQESQVVSDSDKVEILFGQMQMIAYNNKMFLKLA